MTPTDFDGDGTTDKSVYRPSTGQWFVRGGSPEVTQYGATGDIAVPGDYDGDGTADKAIYRPSTGQWFVLGSPEVTQYGATGDIPVPGDYDGGVAATTDKAVYRPSTGQWFVRGGSPEVTQYGATGDIPAPGDYDGGVAATTDKAVYRPSTGQWFVRGGSPEVTQYGVTGDIPAPGDYDGGGTATTDKAVYRPSTGQWFVRGGSPEVTQYGVGTDVPLALPDAVRRVFFGADGNPVLAIATTSLPDAVGGISYNRALEAVGGTPPYAWTAWGLPAGLGITPDGLITGFPTSTGTSTVTATVSDAVGAIRTAALTLAVPETVPAQCVAQDCSMLTPDPGTAEVPAAQVVSVGRDLVTGAPSTIVVSGAAPAPQRAAVFAAGPAFPSGFIALVNTATPNGDGTTTLAVEAATPGSAYAEGTVQGLGTPAVDPTATGAGPPSPAAAAAPLTCGGGVEVSGGATVTPSLTPSVAALWKRPLFGGGGIYVGTGGLQLFQFDLEGSITVAIDASISASASCTANLPRLTTVVPVGALGAVVLDLTPSLMLDASGTVAIHTSVTLNCIVEYRWSEGREYRVATCGRRYEPLQLASSTGADVTLTASLATSVTLNEVAGITGNLSAALHGGYRPLEHPVAVLDARADYNLGACLGCFWSGGPQVTLVSGNIFKRVLATYDTEPPRPGGALAMATASLPGGFAGRPYDAALAAVGGQPPYLWSLTAGAIPAGLTLGAATGRITGTPTTVGPASFTARVTDQAGATATAPLTLAIAAIGGGSGSVLAWGWNGSGQLGDGTTTTRPAPVGVLGLAAGSGVVAVSAGASDGLALGSDGSVLAWGSNVFGQLGDGTTADRLAPVRVSGLGARSGVVAVSAGLSHSLALRSDGSVLAWGYNSFGGLGDGTTTRLAPVGVSGLGAGSGVVAVSAGYALSLALTPG
ncbi:MAG: putative Ig domain-containing protein [Acidimicrobiales bacterium]